MMDKIWKNPAINPFLNVLKSGVSDCHSTPI